MTVVCMMLRFQSGNKIHLHFDTTMKCIRFFENYMNLNTFEHDMYYVYINSNGCNDFEYLFR